jgi:hypothetical protein
MVLIVVTPDIVRLLSNTRALLAAAVPGVTAKYPRGVTISETPGMDNAVVTFKLSTVSDGSVPSDVRFG